MATLMHRKPVGAAQAGRPEADMQTPRPLPSQYNPDRLNSHASSSHTRARTNSSSVMPNFGGFTHSPPLAHGTTPSPAYTMTSQHQYQQPVYPPQQQQRRTLSNATSSTSSSTTNLNRNPANAAYANTAYTNAAYANAPRRSTSSRSTSSVPPTSYVALMRKQKATVWCDRAQHEDPRILAAQRQARMRAAAEVAGGHNYATAQSRTSTSSTGVVGGVRSKIRHHGAPKASAYNAGLTPGGAGVPMRLSASEVDDGNNSDEDVERGKHHTRNGSGRSSLGSGRNKHPYRISGMSNSYSNGNTPPGASPVDSIGEEETPMPQGGDGAGSSRHSYFAQGEQESEEKLDVVGGLPNTGPGGSRFLSPEEQIARQKKNAEDLRRRGSVDERTATMTGPRLFVANPDLSD